MACYSWTMTKGGDGKAFGVGVFWKLEALSDQELLNRVGGVLGSSRRLVAELIAQLGEVEERRLHLAAACSSMFAYCLRLGMTEDEACRRIEVARLARRYPAIFPLLAAGEVSPSVVALLRHHLSDDHHLELLAAVSGKSVQQAREVIAARFPRPDVASSVRKLPERPSCTGVVSTDCQPSAAPRDAVGGGVSNGGVMASSPQRAPSRPPSQRPSSLGIEPLSAQRYEIQFTAGVELKDKLELARDLMRHSLPSGDVGAIVERALDLLIEDLMKRRFGAQAGSKASASVRAKRTNTTNAAERRAKTVGAEYRDSTDARKGTERPTMKVGAEPTKVAKRCAATVGSEPADAAVPDNTSARENRVKGAEPPSRYIPREAPERSRAGWSGMQLGRRAGGAVWRSRLARARSSPPARERRQLGAGQRAATLSRHNRWEAEAAFGREHVERAITDQRRTASRHDDPRYGG